MDNDEEIKNEEIEVVIENNEPTDEMVEEIKEEKGETEKRGCHCHTKLLDNWLFFCFDVLLLIFVLGISLYIVDMRENLLELNKKADRIEEYYEQTIDDVTDDSVDTINDSADENSTEVTENEVTSVESTGETAEISE